MKWLYLFQYGDHLMFNRASCLYLREELQGCCEMFQTEAPVLYLITVISFNLVKNIETKPSGKYSSEETNLLILARKGMSLNIYLKKISQFSQ